MWYLLVLLPLAQDLSKGCFEFIYIKTITSILIGLLNHTTIRH